MGNATVFQDVRVLDLSRVLSGPYATMMLGDLGADVWKIEPVSGDPTRTFKPPAIGGEAAYYLSLNRNKRSLCLNFRHPAAVDVLTRLAAGADVLVENFLPSVKEQLGIGYEALAADNPRLIYCSISGFGQDGPNANAPGLDNIFQGRAGLMMVTGDGERPMKVGERIADVIAGLNASQAISAALYARERSGTGQYIELSLVDCLIAAQAPMISYYFATGTQPPAQGNRSIFTAPCNTYETADRPINLCVAVDKHWKILCETLGLHALADDPRFRSNSDRVANAAEIDAALAPRFREHGAERWLRCLAEVGVPAGPVHTYEDVFDDPQIRHNGMLRTQEHPTAGRLRSIGFPTRYSATPARSTRHSPLLGEHSTEILEEAGFSPQDIEHLLREDVVIPARDG